jgi:antitoxin component of RelBE/YafQ-DinJ toxin-antitoxin module
MPKTLAIRLDDDLHAAAQAVAQLQGISLTELIRSSIETTLQAKRDSGELAAQAQNVLAEIDAEAENRRKAIASLLGPADAPAPKPAPRSRKASTEGT